MTSWFEKSGFERARAMAAKWKIELKKPCLATKQRHGVNVPAATPIEYWRRSTLPTFGRSLIGRTQRTATETARHKNPQRSTCSSQIRQTSFSTLMNPT